MTTTNKNASGKSAALDAFKERWKTLAAREQMLVLIAATVVGLAVVWWVLLSPALKTLRTAPAEHAQLDRQLQHMRSLQQEALELQKAPRLQNDDAVRGFAIGLAAHGIGTARAFQISAQAGAFAALAMGLNGILTALCLPWILPWLERLGGR